MIPIMDEMKIEGQRENMQGKDWLWSRPIAHRGLHDDNFPENSLPAFEAAAGAGIPIEFDVQLSKDGQAIVVHDENLLRLTGTNREVEKMTTAEIKALRFRGTDFSIPTLEETLSLIDGRVPILVEVKKHKKPLEQMVCDQLRAYPGEFAVQSFNPMVLRAIRRIAPEFVCGLLSSKFEHQKLLRIQKAGIKNARLFFMAKQPDFLSFEIHSFPNRRIAGFRQDLGIPILGWVITSLGELEIAEKFCDNIIFENLSTLQAYVDYLGEAAATI